MPWRRASAITCSARSPYPLAITRAAWPSSEPANATAWRRFSSVIAAPCRIVGVDAQRHLVETECAEPLAQRSALGVHPVSRVRFGFEIQRDPFRTELQVDLHLAQPGKAQGQMRLPRCLDLVLRPSLFIRSLLFRLIRGLQREGHDHARPRRALPAQDGCGQHLELVPQYALQRG